jgi:hypothetical protein
VRSIGLKWIYMAEKVSKPKETRPNPAKIQVNSLNFLVT